jgi:hypothetical protein
VGHASHVLTSPATAQPITPPAGKKMLPPPTAPDPAPTRGQPASYRPLRAPEAGSEAVKFLELDARVFSCRAPSTAAAGAACGVLVCEVLYVPQRSFWRRLQSSQAALAVAAISCRLWNQFSQPQREAEHRKRETNHVVMFGSAHDSQNRSESHSQD